MTTRNIRIGVAVNSPNNDVSSTIEKQYIKSDEFFGRITKLLKNYDVEVVKIEANGNLFSKIADLIGDIDAVFNLGEVLYQIAVPLVIDQVKFEHNADLACTSAGAEGHLLALNKVRARQILLNKINQPKWWYAEGDAVPQLAPEDFPVIVKPINAAHSIGIYQKNVVYNNADLAQIIAELRTKFSDRLLIEGFLDGVEYSMGLVGNVIMPGVSWDLSKIPGNPLIRGEYLKKNDLTLPHATIVRDATIHESLATQVATAFIELGLRDYCRSDFRGRKHDPTPYYLETNSAPGLQSIDSVLPWAALRAGVSYDQLIAGIIWSSLKRLPQEYLKKLNTHKLKTSYQNLQNQGGKRIQVKGQEFILMMPL